MAERVSSMPEPNPNPHDQPFLPDINPGQTVFGSGTYVIQIPKDQVYRVPPPENELIIERHRNPDAQKQKPFYSSRFCSALFLGIVAVALAIALTIYWFFG